MSKPRRTSGKKQAEAEVIAKGADALRDFDESTELVVPAKKRESKLISIRLPTAMIAQLRDVAAAKGDVGYQQMIKTYIADGLMRDKAFSGYSWR